ncbi:MAG TPA: nicotinate-nucleotide adenylyltransferase [Flavobacteriales bacterium]|nr:nicotinate-nucleotide adenylyltransferase [Flavobacteriales bacterium]
MTGRTNKGNVGLYFGSFNPIHLGHLVIANHMVSRGGLDQVWIVVTPTSPFKLSDEMIPEEHRLQMVKLAIADNPFIFSSDIEFWLERPSYTADTLKHLRDKFPEVNFSVILGEDNYENLHRWKNYKSIHENHRLLVYPRRLTKMSGLLLEKTPNKDNPLRFDSTKAVIFTEAPMIAISSTYIREAILEKQDVQYLLPDTVISYIGNNHLYEIE